MQGSLESIKENGSFFDAAKETIKTCEDIKIFFNIHKFSMPSDTEEIKERIKINIERFRGNYILIFLLFSIIFIIKQILVIPVILLWTGYCYLSFKDNIIINGIELKKEYMLISTIILTLVYLVVFNSIISTMLILFSLAVIIIAVHSITYKMDEPEEQV